jgi:large subunit ribosomal protein L25
LLWELEVECLPTQIPDEIPVDVSQLKIGDVIYVKDLSLPAEVKALNEPDALVFSLEPPVKEEEVAALPTVEGEEPAEPEVIKEKKETAEEGKAKEKEEKAE